jgi:hypothetical protein
LALNAIRSRRAGSPRKAPRHIAEMVRKMFEQLTRHDGRSDAAVFG